MTQAFLGRAKLLAYAHARWAAVVNYCCGKVTIYHPEAQTYRPEAYYMRGPGPKWREKHAHAGD